MTQMGRYGEMAARHMARWLPSSFAAIPEAEREEYFMRLDEEVSQQIADRERSLKPPQSLQESDHLEYVGQLRMARLMAEEEVLREMVYLEPEPGLESEADEPERDEMGAFVDRGWRSPAQEIYLSDEEWEDQQKAGQWRPITDPPYDPYEEDNPN